MKTEIKEKYCINLHPFDPVVRLATFFKDRTNSGYCLLELSKQGTWYHFDKMVNMMAKYGDMDPSIFSEHLNIFCELLICFRL